MVSAKKLLEWEHHGIFMMDGTPWTPQSQLLIGNRSGFEFQKGFRQV